MSKAYKTSRGSQKDFLLLAKLIHNNDTTSFDGRYLTLSFMAYWQILKGFKLKMIEASKITVNYCILNIF